MINLRIENCMIVIDTDDPSFGSLFKYQTSKGQYNYYARTYVYQTVSRNIYDSCHSIHNGWRYKFKLGWGVYIINMYRSSIGVDNINKIMDTLYSKNYRIEPFPNLRDYQNDDVLHLLKYKYGLFSCYTSYGKTETIATLIKYIYETTKKKILLLVPSNKCKDELVKRCHLDRFGIDIPTEDGRIDLIVTNGVSASNKYKDRDKLAEQAKYLSTFDYVIADEVEYIMSPGGCKVLNMCTNATVRYGFSGTADKIGGKLISFSEGLTDVVTRNTDLIGYFGQALVFRLATHLNVNMIYIKTSCFNKIKFTDDDFEGDGNIYLDILTKTWTCPEVSAFITKLIKYYPMMFIPVNNLVNIISNWIDNYWLGKYRILLISGAGYTYYDLDESVRQLSLKEACDVINKGEVDVIPSTSSGYRALDLPGLTNILLIQGKIGGVVLQSIGRVARGSFTNIINLNPEIMVPIYSKGIWNRSNMIKDYYKYCTINKINKHESEFV
jgi:hypothetical protein